MYKQLELILNSTTSGKHLALRKRMGMLILLRLPGPFDQGKKVVFSYSKREVLDNLPVAFLSPGMAEEGDTLPRWWGIRKVCFAGLLSLI